MNVVDKKATINQSAQRIHPLWILFRIIDSIRQLIVFLLFFYFLDFNSIFLKVGEIAIVLYLFYRIISAFFDWWHFKYLFTDRELHIYEGRFIKRKRFIPLENIQGINRDTPFFQRLFKLTSLLLSTGATGDESSVKLEMITYKEAERIQKHLRPIVSNYKGISEQNEQTSEVPEAEHHSRNKHFAMTSREIFIFSLTSLKFFLIIPVIDSIYSSINDFFVIDKYIDPVISFFRSSLWLTVFGIIILIILFIVYGFLNTYIRYRDFKVTSDQHRIYINKGMFSKTEFSIPKEKVYAIKFNSSLIQRWLGLVEVKTISTGNIKDEEMGKTETIFPFISKKKALRLVPEILPKFQIETEMIKLPRSAIFVKLVRLSYFWIVTTAVIFFYWPKLWYISLILLILIIISRLLDGFYSRYQFNGSFLQLQKAAIFTKLIITPRGKIEELKVTESWLQRKFGLASLKVSIRSKPIQVSAISDIPKEVAIRYYQWYAEEETGNDKG